MQDNHNLAQEQETYEDPFPKVLLLKNKYVKGHGSGERLSFVDMSSRIFETDAHFTAYEAEERFTKESFSPTRMTLFVIDVDCEAAHRDGDEASQEWRQELANKAKGIDAWGYWTRGGARLVWPLSEPFIIDCAEAMEKWREMYRQSLIWVFSTFGIIGDPACCDWTRLYRAPHVIREGQTEPEQRGWFCKAPWLASAWFWPRLRYGDELASFLKLSQENKAWASAFKAALPAPKPNDSRINLATGNTNGAIAYAVSKVLNSGKGNRNKALFEAASFLQKPLKKCEITENQIFDALEPAARSVGITSSEARKTIKSAFKRQP